MKRLIFLLGLCCCLAAVAQEQTMMAALCLRTTDGAAYDFLIADQRPQVVCQHEQMVVTYTTTEGASGSLSFSRDAVAQLTIAQRDMTPVKGVKGGDDGRVTFNLTAPGRVCVSGLADGEAVHAYTADGKMAVAPVYSHDGKAVVDLTGQQRGIYLLRAGNRSHTFKILKP